MVVAANLGDKKAVVSAPIGPKYLNITLKPHTLTTFSDARIVANGIIFRSIRAGTLGRIDPYQGVLLPAPAALAVIGKNESRLRVDSRGYSSV